MSPIISGYEQLRKNICWIEYDFSETKLYSMWWEIYNYFSFQQNISPSKNNMSKAAKNVIKTMLTISIVFLLCWTPNTIYFILYSARSDILLSGTIYSITVYAVFGNAIVNPFIYSVQYAPFQQQVKQLFCRNRSEGDSVATISSRSHSYTPK